YPALELGRGIFLIGFSLVAVVLWLWRRLFSAINSQPQFAERVLIFGDGPLAASLARELESRPELGIRVAGHVLPTEKRTSDFHCEGREPTGDPPETVTDEELSRAVKFHRANRIVVAMGDRRGKLPVELLLSFKSHGVRIQDGSDVYEAITGKVPIECVRLGWL